MGGPRISGIPPESKTPEPSCWLKDLLNYSIIPNICTKNWVPSKIKKADMVSSSTWGFRSFPPPPGLPDLVPRPGGAPLPAWPAGNQKIVHRVCFMFFSPFFFLGRGPMFTCPLSPYHIELKQQWPKREKLKMMQAAK